MTEWADKNKIFISLPTEQILAITAYGEARSEGGEGMMAVLNVIKNRTKDLNRFADSEILSLTGSPYHAVILKPYQFSMYNPGTYSREIAEDLANNFYVKLLSDNELQIAYKLSVMLLTGDLVDNTGGADHYHSVTVKPSWSSEFQKTAQIGNHIFYASVPGLGVTLAGLTESPISLVLWLGLIVGITYRYLKKK